MEQEEVGLVIKHQAEQGNQVRMHIYAHHNFIEVCKYVPTYVVDIIYVCMYVCMYLCHTHNYYNYAASSAPVITEVVVIDSYSARVTWRAPAEPNGVITGYIITVAYDDETDSFRVNESVSSEIKSELRKFKHIL